MVRNDAASRRERRVMVGGAAVLALALVVTFVVVPFARQWRVREGRIAAAEGRVALLQQLQARTADLETAADNAERALAAQPRRVMHARSITLAASALQTLLQDMADASPLVVTRLEVSADEASPADTSTASPHVPATLSAYGDITGVATFLHHVAAGPRVLVLDRLSVQRNAALLGAADVVQLSMTLHAPVISP